MYYPSQQRFFYKAIETKLAQCYEDHFECSMAPVAQMVGVMQVRYNEAIRELAMEFPTGIFAKYADQLFVNCEFDKGTVKVTYSEQLRLLKTGEATFGAPHD